MAALNFGKQSFKTIKSIEDWGNPMHKLIDFGCRFMNFHGILGIMEEEFFLLVQMNISDLIHQNWE